MGSFCSIFLSFLLLPYMQLNEQEISSDTLFKQASEFLDNADYAQAISNLKKIRNDRRWGQSEENLRKTFNNLGFAYFNINEFDSSIFYYQKAHEYALALKDTARMISSLNSIALNYQQSSRLARAIDYSRRALALSESQFNNVMTARILSNIGTLYGKLDENEQALDYHKRSFSLSHQERDSINMAVALHKIAISHKMLGQLDSSLFYNFKSLELKRELGNKPGFIVSTLNNIGTTNMSAERYSDAKSYLLESNQLYKQIKDTTGLLTSFNNLAELAIKLNQYDLAQVYLDSASFFLDTVKELTLKKDFLSLQVSVAEIRGDLTQALDAYREFSKINDSIFKSEKLNVERLESGFVIKQKEMEAIAFKQEAELEKLRAKKGNQLAFFLSLMLLIALIVSIVYIRFNRKLKESYQIIQTQKLELKHTTYNTLMRIQALLRITSSSITDQYSKERLMKAESAILSAASLQQFTYDIENEDQVDLGQFLIELVERLKASFENSGQENIQYVVNTVPNVVLPVQTVLNCGLIVSEIISNSLKHAFPGIIENPRIQVDLISSGAYLLLKVGDNGIGIIPVLQQAGVGSGLVEKLCQQMKAQLTIENDIGTSYKIKLKANHELSL
jgi:two-component sensor histidine kinase